MSVSLPPLQAFPPGLAIFIAVSAAAAAWVAQDARARFAGGPGEGWVWAIGTLVALPIFLPLYLIAARPVGSVAVCPSCGRRTIGHRAACLHCGHPITFEAFPDTWGWGEVVGIAVVFMISLPVIAQAIGVEEVPTLAELSAFAVAQNLLFLALAAYVARVRYRRPLTELGLRGECWPAPCSLPSTLGRCTSRSCTSSRSPCWGSCSPYCTNARAPSSPRWPCTGLTTWWLSCPSCMDGTSEDETAGLGIGIGDWR